MSRLGPLGVPTSSRSGGAVVPPPPVGVRTTLGKPVTSRSIDWRTLQAALGGAVTDRVESYEFSNGRKFYQPVDDDL
jgi:hypothetical protein